MKTSALITLAWYHSGIVPREAAQPSDTQSQDGLNLLNGFLASMGIDGQGIPYTTHAQINLITNQESYFVPNLVEVKALTFNLQNVRFSLIRDDCYTYFGRCRVNDILSLPYHYFDERQNGGTQLWFYFLPYQTLPLNITGRYTFTPLRSGDELSATFDDWFVEFLKYKLAQRMCAFYDQPFPMLQQEILTELERRVNKVDPPDLKTRTLGMFTNNNTINWGQANLGRGWTT